MYELVILASGITIGVLFKDQIVGFKGRASRAWNAAVSSFNK